ncbi:hypothetical protein ABZ726_08945 [Streptomyces hundungensis]|uniref:hypothetical protein n=1 Tax=Streptomyces hundungensis TaxID=1077946 RepID=UPI0034076306
MATRKNSTDDPLAPVTLAVGQEDLLLDRAVQQVVAAARAADSDTDVRDLSSEQVQPGTLAELTSPSLFAERKVVVVRNAHDLSADTVKDVKAYLDAPAEEITLVLLHAGGAKGKGLLDAARKAGAREVARVVSEADAGAALGRNLQLLRPEPDALDPWFLAGFLRGTANNRQASSYATTASRLDVRRLHLPRLPLAEQRRYGERFRALAAFEDALRLAGRLGEQLVQGLHDGLTDGTVEPE